MKKVMISFIFVVGMLLSGSIIAGEKISSDAKLVSVFGNSQVLSLKEMNETKGEFLMAMPPVLVPVMYINPVTVSWSTGMFWLQKMSEMNPFLRAYYNRR
ncbi:MAG: hypothetical protein ISR65_18575 [Bacteriovoracaceae bacterium]|nr:hypothetical protein [Bacteriovoracaceae bacterium]